MKTKMPKEYKDLSSRLGEVEIIDAPEGEENGSKKNVY